MLKVDIYKKYTSNKRDVLIRCKTVIGTLTTTALYGKSGVGKSSILRMIAGLESADEGSIELNGTPWYSKNEGVNLPIAKRKIGFVFQDYNLFPNMNVSQNLSYASGQARIPDYINELLDATQFSDLMTAYPKQLSGGQKQGVAIIRALCQSPDLLLLDEPFSALDDESISELIEKIKLIQQRFKMTVIVVSHRKDIVFEMAQRVVHLLNNGKVLAGTPNDILQKSF